MVNTSPRLAEPLIGGMAVNKNRAGILAGELTRWRAFGLCAATHARATGSFRDWERGDERAAGKERWHLKGRAKIEDCVRKI